MQNGQRFDPALKLCEREQPIAGLLHAVGNRTVLEPPFARFVLEFDVAQSPREMRLSVQAPRSIG